MGSVLSLAMGWVQAAADGLGLGALRVVKVEAATEGVIASSDQILTLQRGNGPTWRVRGSCTVWHQYPSGKRVGTLGEGEIVDALRAYEWRNEARS